MKKKVTKKAVKKEAAFWRVGEKYFIRTVTNYHTGRLASIDDRELVLHDAAWIADTGRFHTALTTGTLNEVEPFPGPVCINRSAIDDATIWQHDLPRVQK